MGLRSWLKRLERASREEMVSFELLDGSRYYCPHDAAARQVYLHFLDCACGGSAHNWPEPPEVVRKLTEAKNVAQAYEELVGNEGAYEDIMPYDLQALIRKRRFVPRPLISRYDPDLGQHVPVDSFSEENVVPDLSEP